MRSLRELDPSLPLTLAKPSWKRGLHELRAGTEVVGTLDVNSWSGGSVAATADGGWRFERPRGFLRRTVRILGAGEVELGSFGGTGFGARGGNLELGSRSYALTARGVFKPRFAWSAGDGAELAAFTASGGLGAETKGSFELSDSGRACPDAALLLLLGAHLALLSQRESASGAGASTAATSAAVSS